MSESLSAGPGAAWAGVNLNPPGPPRPRRECNAGAFEQGFQVANMQCLDYHHKLKFRVRFRYDFHRLMDSSTRAELQTPKLSRRRPGPVSTDPCARASRPARRVSLLVSDSEAGPGRAQTSD